MKKTAVKKTISLQPDIWDYVSSNAQGNASAFINEALSHYRSQQIKNALIKGYQIMASDRQLADDLALWDTTLLDGLSDEDNPSR
jgi:hypothetical protein